VLHDFGGMDGVFPNGLIFDAAGVLYGTTEGGGGWGRPCNPTGGCGTVFELSPEAGGGWTEQVLYSFCAQTDCTDGDEPYAGLIFDAAGNLYGTTFYGGTYGYGTVFELTPEAGGGWTEKVVYSFNPNNGTDGAYPYAGLIFDNNGNLYGTTSYGGTYDYGMVFELTPAQGGGWTEQVLYSFNFNGTDGYGPLACLIFDKAGNLFGTTVFGGTYDSGTVFELTPAEGGGWTEKVPHSFNGRNDGANPYAGLILDENGNLYGTTAGGQGRTHEAGANNAGTVFELMPTKGGGWAEKVLHSFSSNGRDGASPGAGLIFDAAGNLYGTTSLGGPYGFGTVFEITH
jgi:uncharacterized repeat protein (TIGR03803 family)